MLSKFFKNNKTILAVLIILAIFIVYVYIHKDVVETLENISKTTCDMEKCKKNCPDLDINCLKQHADDCGDCKFSLSEISEKIQNKSFHNSMNIEQPPQKPVNIYVMNQNDPSNNNNNDEKYMLGILPNRGPSSVNDFNESIIFSGPKKKNYVLVNPKSGDNIFPITTSTTGMFTQTGYYPSNTGDEKGSSKNAAPNVDQFKQPNIDLQYSKYGNSKKPKKFKNKCDLFCGPDRPCTKDCYSWDCPSPTACDKVTPKMEEMDGNIKKTYTTV